MAKSLKHDIKEAIEFYRAHEAYENQCAKKYPIASEEYISCVKGAGYNRGLADALQAAFELIEEYIG